MSVQLLGVILAGGRSRRFGSDKALAEIEGRAMLDHVADRLKAQCETVAVAGRDWPGLPRVDDLPRSGLGPLGGLAGALVWARAHGRQSVLTSGCDLPFLPLDIADRLGVADAIIADQPTVGLWRSAHADDLVGWLETEPDRSIRAWADAVGARHVRAPPMPNVNRRDDLAALSLPAGPRSSP